jgi:hypothetical protein
LIKIKAVLLAPNDPTSIPSRSEPRLTAREEANFNYALIALCAGLFTFSLFAGIGLASGRVPVERAYLLMTPLPLSLVIWFAMGAFRTRPSFDLGLLLSSLGWAFVLFTLLVKHMAVQSAITAGTPLSQVSDGALSWLLALLALIALGAGAWLSWQKAHEGN